jgi:hypothetical protein
VAAGTGLPSKQWAIRPLGQFPDPAGDLLAAQGFRQRAQVVHRRIELQQLRVLRLDRGTVEDHPVGLGLQADPERRGQLRLADAEHARRRHRQRFVRLARLRRRRGQGKRQHSGSKQGSTHGSSPMLKPHHGSASVDKIVAISRPKPVPRM